MTGGATHRSNHVTIGLVLHAQKQIIVTVSAKTRKKRQMADVPVAKDRDARFAQEVDSAVGSAEQIGGTLAPLDFVKAPVLEREQCSAALSNPHFAVGVHAG